MSQSKLLGPVRKTSQHLGTCVGGFEGKRGKAHQDGLTSGDPSADLLDELGICVKQRLRWLISAAQLVSGENG